LLRWGAPEDWGTPTDAAFRSAIARGLRKRFGAVTELRERIVIERRGEPHQARTHAREEFDTIHPEVPF